MRDDHGTPPIVVAVEDVDDDYTGPPDYDG